MFCYYKKNKEKNSRYYKFYEQIKDKLKIINENKVLFRLLV